MGPGRRMADDTRAGRTTTRTDQEQAARSLGANASVYRVDPRTGKVARVVRGLTSATGLAVAKNGDIFVAELFRGRIVRARKGTSTASGFLKVALPGDVELRNGQLYATTGVLTGLSGEPGDVPDGRLVRIDR